MIDNQMRVFALCTGFAIIGFVQPAIAAQFDGHWRMVAVTTSGHCGEIPIDVGISRGRIYSTGGSSFGTAFADYPIQLVGRVTAGGAGPDECSGWPAQRPGNRTVQSASGQRDMGRNRTLRCLLWRLDRHSLLMHVARVVDAVESLQTV